MYYPSITSNGSSIVVPIFVDVDKLAITTPPVPIPWGRWEILWSLLTDANPEKVTVYFAPNGIEVGETPSGFVVLNNEQVSKTLWRLIVENSATETSLVAFDVNYQIGEHVFSHDPTILVVNDPVSPNLVKVKA